MRRALVGTRLRPAAAIVACVAFACAGERDDGRAVERRDTPAERAAAEGATPARAADTALVHAARTTLRFLGGDVPFDSLRLADSVTLQLAPEGGGARVRRSRAELREPGGWFVPSAGDRYSLVPPRFLRDTTLKAGAHFNCAESTLASRAPELAALPHVGALLRPGGEASCLQSWNVTFVFEGASVQARLVAVLYDQWEW